MPVLAHVPWQLRASRLRQQVEVEREAEEIAVAEARRLGAALALPLGASALEAVRRAVENGEAEAAAAAAVPGEVLAAEAEPMLARGVGVGRRMAAVAMPKRLQRALPDIEVVRPRAARWAAAHAAELVRGVTDETRAGVRAVVARGIAAGDTPRQIARMIEPVLGLNERQAASMARAAEILRKDGTPEPRVLQVVDRRADIYRKQRAMLIARTETFRAVNEGRNDLWQELVERDLVEAPRVERVWVAAMDERTDDICEQLDGERTTLDGEFSGGYSGPPAHILCRCSLVYEEGPTR